MIQVYYGWPSIFGRKVLCVLEEKGLDYELISINLSKKEQKEADYLKLNPNGQVPTLIDNGCVVYESTAIIEYLEEAHPEPRLMPTTPQDRARARMVEDFIDQRLYISTRNYFRKWVRKEPIEPGMLEAIEADLLEAERRLGAQEYLAGDFSLADCAFMPVLPSLEGMGIGNLLAQSPPLKLYCERLKAHRGFKGAGLEIAAPPKRS